MMTSFVFKKNTFAPASFRFDGDPSNYIAGAKSSYFSTGDISAIPATMYYTVGVPGQYMTSEMKLSYSAWINPLWFTQNFPVEFFSIEVPSVTSGNYSNGSLVFCYDTQNSTLQLRFNGQDNGVVSVYNLYEAPISVGGNDYNSGITGLNNVWDSTNTPLPWIHIGFIFDLNAQVGATTSYTTGTQNNSYTNQPGRVSNRVKMYWNGAPLLTYEYDPSSLPSGYLSFYNVFATPYLTVGGTYVTLGGRHFPTAHKQDQVAIRLGTNVLGDAMMANYYNNPSLSMSSWVQNGLWHYPGKANETSPLTVYGSGPILTPYSNGNLALPSIDDIFFKA